MAAATAKNAFGGGNNNQSKTANVTTKATGDNYVRNPTKTTASSNGNVPQTKTTKSYSSGGGGSPATTSGGGGYSGGNGGDIISMIKSLLEEQKKAADEYTNSLYKQAYAKAEQESEANRNANNLNYMRADRYLKSLYGTGSPVGGGDPSTKFGGGNISGQGLSNQYRNYSNWQNRGTTIRQDLANNKNTLEAQRNANLMNNAGTLASGWYNYILPYYSQDALNKLDYAYRSSLL